MPCLFLSLILFALAPMWSAGCSDEGGSFGEVGQAELRITPSVITFDANAINVLNVQYLTLENIGSGDLVIESFELDTRSDEFEVFAVDLPMTLSPGGQQVVEVGYTPTDCRADRGNLIIHSNDRDRRELAVPLQPQEMTGQVRVHPNPIDFGRVPAGVVKTIDATLTNTGTCALTINDLFITGSFDFSFTQDQDGAAVEYEVPLPITLETGEERVVQVTYSPESDGFDQATMLVRSDDAQNRTVDVDIIANGGAACIVVSDEEGIDYGERFIGESHPKTVTITNCSQQEPLLVSRIDLAEHFELDGLSRYSLSDLPDLSTALSIPPQESTSFVLTYAPEDEVPDGAMLVIESNDEVKSPLEIEVRGIGTLNICPAVSARARVQGSTVWDTQLDTIPLATVEFDGSGSTDAEGTVELYQWEVLERPDGSTALFQPNANVPNPTFFLDFAGQYRFSLRVFDNTGVESCDTAEIIVIVTPDEAIHVQIAWETPGDVTRNDLAGSDVDLHFMHPTGTWNESPGDCFFANSSPDWGIRGRGEDDPSLDIDDTNGWGPENINLDAPEGSASQPAIYKVGVYYYSDHFYGPSNVTLRIFLDGVERFALTFDGLADRQFWDVARIAWPTRDIERVHRLYPSGYP